MRILVHTKSLALRLSLSGAAFAFTVWMSQLAPSPQIAIELLRNRSLFRTCMNQDTPREYRFQTKNFSFSQPHEISKKIEAILKDQQNSSRSYAVEKVIDVLKDDLKISEIEVEIYSPVKKNSLKPFECILNLKYSNPIARLRYGQQSQILLLEDGSIVSEKFTVETYETSHEKSGGLIEIFVDLNLSGVAQNSSSGKEFILSDFQTQDIARFASSSVEIDRLIKLQKDLAISSFIWILGRGLVAVIHEDHVLLGYSSFEERLNRYRNLKLDADKLSSDDLAQPEEGGWYELDFDSKVFVRKNRLYNGKESEKL